MLQEFVPETPRQNQKDSGIKVTKLLNGTRVITHDADDSPLCAIGLYAEAGAKFDPANKPGLNFVLRWGFLCSNFDSSMFQIDRTIRSQGASYEHQEIAKRYIGFKVEGRRDLWKAPFEHLISAATVPRFMEQEIDRYRDHMDAISEEQRWQQPRDHCIENLEQLAFYREPLGNPRLVPAYANDDISSAVLQQQWANTFQPSRIVIAGINVNHDELLAAYENAPFPHDVAAPHFKRAAVPKLGPEAAMYQGGMEKELSEKRYKEMSTKPHLNNETIVAVGWRGYGSENVAEYAVGLVAAQLLDVAFEDGIRIPLSGIDRGARSYFSPFSGVGTWGFTVREDPKEATDALRQAIAVYQGLKPTKISLAAAKRRAAVRFYHDRTEVRRDYLDFLASSLIGEGTTRTSVQDILKAIESVSETDVEKLLSFSKGQAPCMYATGEVLQLPSLRQLGLRK